MIDNWKRDDHIKNDDDDNVDDDDNKINYMMIYEQILFKEFNF